MSVDMTKGYFTRKEIQEHSPSKPDIIIWKKEFQMRILYGVFLHTLGMKLRLPQKTIATSITLCHRFYFRQFFAQNDWGVIAMACMFLVAKAEESRRHLKYVILASHELINKKDPLEARRIREKDVYEQQKELILFEEKLVLQTLCFDLEVQHPYEALCVVISGFKMGNNSLYVYVYVYFIRKFLLVYNFPFSSFL